MPNTNYVPSIRNHQSGGSILTLIYPFLTNSELKNFKDKNAKILKSIEKVYLIKNILETVLLLTEKKTYLEEFSYFILNTK